MARPRQRVRLESGLKLDLNKLLRDGQLKRGQSRHATISWSRGGASVADGSLEVCLPSRVARLGRAQSWFARSADSVARGATALWRRTGVFLVPCHRATRFGPVAAAGRTTLCEQAGLGPASRLRVAIRDAARSRSERGEGYSLRAWRPEFRSLGRHNATQTQRDALAHISGEDQTLKAL